MNKEEQKKLYGCTLAKYKGRIRSSNRKLWMISKGRKDALIRSRTHASSDVKFKFYEHCERCDKAYRIGQKEYTILKSGKKSKKQRPCLIVHHIEPVPDVFDEKFLINLFCEQWDNPVDGYQVLCHECHELTHKEMEQEK